MKIKMLAHMSGLGVSREIGQEIDVKAGEGKRLIEAGFAEAVATAPIETARNVRTGVESTAAKAKAAAAAVVARVRGRAAT